MAYLMEQRFIRRRGYHEPTLHGFPQAAEVNRPVRCAIGRTVDKFLAPLYQTQDPPVLNVDRADTVGASF